MTAVALSDLQYGANPWLNGSDRNEKIGVSRILSCGLLSVFAQLFAELQGGIRYAIPPYNGNACCQVSKQHQAHLNYSSWKKIGMGFDH